MGNHATTFLADNLINHPISTHSTRIPGVCSFVAEAEYGGLFVAARIAVDERAILANLGHPQPPTVIFCDNEVAIGLANSIGYVIASIKANSALSLYPVRRISLISSPRPYPSPDIRYSPPSSQSTTIV
jgi:hypothetical protein